MVEKVEIKRLIHDISQKWNVEHEEWIMDDEYEERQVKIENFGGEGGNDWSMILLKRKSKHK